MATLVIDAAPIELGIFEEQWEALTAELVDAGYEVQIEHLEEWRSGQLPPIDLPDAETIRIFVWVAEELWEEAIGAIVLAVGAAVKRHP